MGVNSLITWAVIDPVMMAVITEMQGSSVVETRASSLAFSRWSNAWVSHLVEMWASSSASSFMWDTGFGPASWSLRWSREAGFDPHVLVLQRCWDAAFKLYVLVRQWCWDADFDPYILVLRQWLWLTLRLEFGLYFLMTCPQWFLDSLKNPLQNFRYSAVDWDGFWNILDSGWIHTSHDWTDNHLRCSDFDPVWNVVFVSVL